VAGVNIPSTMVTPRSRARRCTDEPNGPSSGSAIPARGAPKAYMVASGKTTSWAPAAAASRATLVTFARLAAMSWLLRICASATRIRGPASVITRSLLSSGGSISSR